MTRFNKYGYGTAEYYSELFSDILAEVDAESTPESTQNIYQGFLLAIDSWFEYHNTQADAYSEFRERVRKTLGVL